MQNNIFFKSVLRQPIRAFILAILIGVAAFAFVSRATEFIVVRDELTRIEAFYRAVGILSPTRLDNFTTDHDVTRALDIIENNRHVAFSDTRNFTQGAFTDMFNIAAQSAGQVYFNPVLHGVDIPMMDHFFIGSFRTEPQLLSLSDPPMLVVMLNIDELILGDPSTLRAGDRVFVNEHGQTTTVFSRQHMRLLLTAEEMELFQQELWCPFGGLELNEPALFRATPKYVAHTYASDAVGWFGLNWYLRPLVGIDGIQHTWMERSAGGEIYQLVPGVGGRSHPRDMVFCVDAADEAAIAEILYSWQDEFALLTENLSSVTVIDTKDMTAMPRFMDFRIAHLLDTALFPAGRWITYEDYLQGNPVVVIPASLAVRRGLRIGDSFSINLRDNPRPTWIDTPTESTWARGIENWWSNNPAGWWGTIDAAHHNWQSFPTHELTLEIVGIYWFAPMYFNNFTTAEIFIPAGLIPEGFGWDDAPQLTGMYSFVLNSPRAEAAFLRETQAELYNMGFTAVFMQSGFEHLAAVTDPIRMSVTVNLIVFAVASALILAFAVLLYLRQWRKSVAIAQALGVSGKTVLGQLFIPVVALWVPAIIVGSVIAWFFAIGQAEATLAAIGDYETSVMPGIYMLISFCGLLIVFTLAGLWFGGRGVVGRPVLTQLQGGTQKRRKPDYVDPGVAPVGFAMGDFEMAPLPVTSRLSAVFGTTLWHSMRHIFRTPIKTTLALLLVLMFVFSLGWLNNMVYSTEAEIERLWDTTIIDAELFLDGDPPNFRGLGLNNFNWPAIISPVTWNAIELSGFLGEAYLEAYYWNWYTENAFMGISHLEGFIAENTRTTAEEQLGIMCVDLEIEFLYGFGAEDFVYVAGGPIPFIVRRDMYMPNENRGEYVDALYENGYGSYVATDEHEDEPSENENTYTEEPDELANEYAAEANGFAEDTGQITWQIIGVFDDGLARGIGRFSNYPIYILPIEAHTAIYSGLWPLYWPYGDSFVMDTYYPPYLTARFTIDPARNREVYRLRELMEPVLYDNNLGQWGRFPLSLYIDDDVIHSVIEPMEQSLSLLRVLYPIAIGVAFLLALGISLLTMLQSAKNAAIMRVLGKPRFASQVMLCAEQLMVCVAGILLGFVALAVAGSFVGIAPLYLAGVYLGGAVIGSAIGALVISMRAPLDLLQVKE